MCVKPVLSYSRKLDFATLGNALGVETNSKTPRSKFITPPRRRDERTEGTKEQHKPPSGQSGKTTEDAHFAKKNLYGNS